MSSAHRNCMATSLSLQAILKPLFFQVLISENSITDAVLVKLNCTYTVFSQTSHTFFGKSAEQKLGYVVYLHTNTAVFHCITI